MTLRWSTILLVATLAGCAGGGGQPPADDGERAAKAGGSGGGRYALAGDAYPQEPPDVSEVPDAEPRHEPRSRGGNRESYEVWGKTYRVLPDARGYSREGKASWYGEKFHGYATSNGEIYDMYKMSAAHRSLPLPTFARVTSLDNGRSVIVRVNDRGPFHSDREIDLSYAAAARLDILDDGTGRVRVEAIDVDRWLAENGGGGGEQVRPPGVSDAAREGAERLAASAPTADAAGSGASAEAAPAEGRPRYLQVAALGSADGARALRARLQAELSQPVRVAEAGGSHRVQVGPIARADQLESVREALGQAGFHESFIVKEAE
ncbi:MAG: septal ring lytic transglycosylase RlpA family protein [Halomonas sp.]